MVKDLVMKMINKRNTLFFCINFTLKLNNSKCQRINFNKNFNININEIL